MCGPSWISHRLKADNHFHFLSRIVYQLVLLEQQRTYPGASMYYTLRHAVPTSTFDIFLCSIICTSTTIIFIFGKFFHIYYPLKELKPLKLHFQIELRFTSVRRIAAAPITWQMSTFMKHYDIFLDLFFRLTHKAFLMPRTYPGASMYYTLRHAVPTYGCFLCLSVCWFAKYISFWSVWIIMNIPQAESR